MKWILFILILFCCCSCCLFKKVKQTESFQAELNSKSNLELSVQDSIHKVKNKLSYIQTTRKYTQVKDSAGNIVPVLSEETTTEIKASQTDTKRKKNTNLKKREELNQNIKGKKVDKKVDGDSTLKANLPWWFWLAGLGVVMVLNKKAPL